MCGLVGYVGLTAPVTRQRLVRMRDALSHRGPDDAGLWIGADKAAVGLGHRRLSIIDTRTIGRQPMADASGDIQLIFNGEIYNFAALRAGLEAEGHTFRTKTDTEVIIEMYRARGLDFLESFNGMFALALWDGARGRLVVARDRLGIKPLFYAVQPDGALLFGSEIKALLASKVVDDGLDRQAHFDYLALNYTPGPRTALRGIKKLQPGHFLVWEANATRTVRYWTQDWTQKRTVSFADAAEETLDGLRAAVKRRMIADVPLGMFLSGGIDSTAVLMCMAEVSDRPVQAFTIRFDEAAFDESQYARLAANHFGADHHVETVRPDVDTFLGPLTDAMDEPYADSSAIPLWYLSRLARQHVTVALGGDGGDELFAGYRTHFAWRLANAYRQLPGPVRDRLVPALVARLPVSHGKVSFDLKARAFVEAAGRTPAQAHFGFKEFMREDARRALMLDSGGLAPTERLFEAAFAAQAFTHGLDAVLASDFDIYLPDDILVKVDRMSMAHGLEARVPFLDHEFVQSTAQLSAHHKLRGLQTKAALKRALRGRVPEQLLKRRKAGFNVPMAQWLSGPLRPLVRDMLAPARVKRIGLWRPEGVSRLLMEHESKQRDHSRTIWALLCFSLFNARFRGDRAA